MANVYLDQGFHTIVATCAFCGRWRDSVGDWHTPPTMVEVMIEQKIIRLTHTYCPPCLRDNASTMGGHIAMEIADEAETRHQLFPRDPNDVVYNLIQTLCTPVANAQSLAKA